MGRRCSIHKPVLEGGSRTGGTEAVELMARWAQHHVVPRTLGVQVYEEVMPLGLQLLLRMIISETQRCVVVSVEDHMASVGGRLINSQGGWALLRLGRPFPSHGENGGRACRDVVALHPTLGCVFESGGCDARRRLARCSPCFVLLMETSADQQLRVFLHLVHGMVAPAL